jgi:hypothetical protein
MVQGRSDRVRLVVHRIALASGRRGRRFKSGHPNQLTGHSHDRTWPFPMPYSSKVHQRLRAKLPPEPLERFERPGIGDLDVGVHRYVDLRMAQDPNGNPRMHVEGSEKSGTGMCLMLCTVKRRTPAFAQRVSKRRFRFRGSKGVPARVKAALRGAVARRQRRAPPW